LSELARQVGQAIGEPDGVIVFDPSGFQKKGNASVGVARQWLGRLGKVDNGQVGVYMGYASRVEHALVDVRLYLPKEWSQDKTRRRACGVPKRIRFRSRHDLALEMLAEQGGFLPHAWIAGDDEMGRSTRFRRDLRGSGEHYILAVPSNTNIRDLAKKGPPYRGQGPRPKPPFERVDRWREALPAQAWERVEVRDGEKGPLVVEMAKARVVARTERSCRHAAEELLVVSRCLDENGNAKHDYYLSNADPDTPLEALARAVKAEHRVEECLQRGKSEAGLADYEVRTWAGWHHHQALSLIATWFLVQETRRAKKKDAGAHGSPSARGPCDPPVRRLLPRRSPAHRP
jgi:SRSO17 transposase